MGEAEGVAGGNQDEFLHNLTASLGIACGLLCLFSAYGVASHRVTIMSQVGSDYGLLRRNVLSTPMCCGPREIARQVR